MQLLNNIDELRGRCSRVQRVMRECGVEALLVSDNSSILYMCGRIFSGVVYVALDGEPILFVRRPVGMEGEQVAYIRKVEDIAAHLSERGRVAPANIALEGDVVSYNEYQRLAKIFNIEPQNVLSSATAIMRKARSVKSPYEVEQVRQSARQHAKLYELIPSLFRRGMSDVDLAIELEREARRLGSVGNMRIFGRSMEVFIGSILVGDNADSPSPYDFALGGAGVDGSLPVGCNGTMITDGTTIMVDQGGNFGTYMTDMTRVYSLGRIPDEAYRAHCVALEMQAEMEARVREGVATADIYNMCIERAKLYSLEQYFMGHKQQAGFVGHGVGIEVNEQPVIAPRSRECFEVGNVFAFEPKFVLPNIGAVGVENTFVVGANGVEKLTQFEESIIPIED